MVIVPDPKATLDAKSEQVRVHQQRTEIAAAKAHTLAVAAARLKIKKAKQAASASAAQPAVTQQPAVPVPPATGGNRPPAAFTACVISRESGGDPTAYNSSSGASGLFGMLLSTWLSTGVGYPHGAYTAPSSVQYQAYYILYARDGASPWSAYDGC